MLRGVRVPRRLQPRGSQIGMRLRLYWDPLEILARILDVHCVLSSLVKF